MVTFLAIVASVLAIALVILIWLNSDLKKENNLYRVANRSTSDRYENSLKILRGKLSEAEQNYNKTFIELGALQSQMSQNKVPNTPARRFPKSPKKR